jgi:ABC-type glycerol-3-phosphate transport system permease component
VILLLIILPYIVEMRVPIKPASGNEQTGMLSKFNQKLTNVLIFLALLGLSISNLYPLFYMFMNSVKDRTDYYVNPFSVWGLKLTGKII